MATTLSETLPRVEDRPIVQRQDWLVRIVLRPGIRRSMFLVTLHILLLSFSLAMAFGVRFDFAVPTVAVDMLVMSLPWVVALKLTVFYVLSHFHGWWRYVTFADLAALFRAATMSLLAIAAIDHIVMTGYQLPRSILLLDWSMTILIFGGLRSTCRLLHESGPTWFNRKDRRRALIVGADFSVSSLGHLLRSLMRSNRKVVGFLDINSANVGTLFGGVPVLGIVDDFRNVAVTRRIQDVLILEASLSGRQVRMLKSDCERLGLTIKIVPDLERILSLSHVDRMCMRDVNIDDLLRREPIELDSDAIGKLLNGRTVMVTGAGGSIGAEISRQILRFRPERVILVERFENSLFLIERELQHAHPKCELHAFIGDVTDHLRMKQAFGRFRPDVVFHAAAHKHVPMMEANLGEAIKNNFLGTVCVADLAEQFGTDRFVLISTDKAVNPSSVMGVTKQLAERYVYSMSQRSATRFVAVRFGNVLGSAGSVIPIFQEQIRKRQPITVTHPDMERYFMTIPEASQLVLQAAVIGEGGEIFVLDMGDPVRIVDLAVDLIQLSGLRADDIDIVYTGMRPGEKLHEELYFRDESSLPARHPKIRIVCHRPYSIQEVDRSLKVLKEVLHEPDQVVRQALRACVPEFANGTTANPLDNEPRDLPESDQRIDCGRVHSMTQKDVVRAGNGENCV